MTDKERIYNSLEGKPIDRMPVTVLYNQLYFMDHFSELTGKEPWEMHKWLNADPEEHVSIYEEMIRKAPFEILQPLSAPPRDVRENLEFIIKDGKVYRHDKKEGHLIEVETKTVSGHATDYHSNQTQYVFNKSDIKKFIKIQKAEDMISSGCNDYLTAVVEKLGKEHFILSGGVVGTLYLCHQYVGLTNLYYMLIEKPDFIEYLSCKILEQNIENIRYIAKGGGDAIYIDDAMTTSDMISLKHFERFSIPFMKEMVNEIHRLGHKAIIIYFGGIADRLEQIASIGADGLSMETSMKNYVNDIEEIAERIGDKVSLFGNIDPIGILQNGTDAELSLEIYRQAKAAEKSRGFIMCTGSPITPFTPIERVRRFIELSRSIKIN